MSTSTALVMKIDINEIRVNVAQAIAPMSTMVMVMSAISAINTMTITALAGESIPIGQLGGMSAFNPSKASGELAEIQERIRKLSFVIDNLNIAVKGRPEYVTKVMHEYKLTVMPSMVEMRAKYPRLYSATRMLNDSQKDLDHAELNMLFLQRRRKQLQISLGLRVDDEERKHQITIMNKYNSVAKDVYGSRSENSPGYKRGGYSGQR